MKLRLFFLLFALFVFNTYVGMAQTSVKSGNIRDCEVWACSSNTFKDATIFVGPHNIVASSNSVNTNSIDFTLNLDGSRQSSSITFNGNDGINFSGTTDMSVCFKTDLDQTVLDIAANNPVIKTGASGTSNLTSSLPATGEVTMRFYFEVIPDHLKANCNNGSTASYAPNTIYEVRLKNTLLFTISAKEIFAIGPGYGPGTGWGVPRPHPSGNGTFTVIVDLPHITARAYIREFKQNVTAGDYIWIGVKVERTYPDDPCAIPEIGSSFRSYNNETRATKATVKVTDCRGTF